MTEATDRAELIHALVSGGSRWRPIENALRAMSEKDDYFGPMRFWKAIQDGSIRIIGRRSNGNATDDAKFVPIAQLGDYHLAGLFGAGEGLPAGPFLMRNGAQLPEHWFPVHSPNAEHPPMPKTWAYTDYWHDLKYDHHAFEAWRSGAQKQSDDAVLSLDEFDDEEPGRNTKRNTAAAVDACKKWLIGQMKDEESPRLRFKDAKKIALAKFEGLSGRGFRRAWDEANRLTGAGWDQPGRPSQNRRT